MNHFGSSSLDVSRQAVAVGGVRRFSSIVIIGGLLLGLVLVLVPGGGLAG